MRARPGRCTRASSRSIRSRVGACASWPAIIWRLVASASRPCRQGPHWPALSPASQRAKRAFVADASHELRTPLTVIAGQIEVLAEQENLSSEEVRRVQKLVQAEIARTSRLLDDLLLLAKAEQDHFLRVAPIALQAFIAEMWESLTTLADRHFELDRIPAGTLIADPDRLTQALRNMLTNAITHTTPTEGLVQLSAKPAPGGQIKLVVQDDGPGIPAVEREHVFDRFHRTDTARNRALGGTGLGLAIVRAIALAHEGHVAATQAPTGGTRIELQLPGFTPLPQPDLSSDMPARASSG